MKFESRHWAFLGLLIVTFASMLIGFRPKTTVSVDTQRMFNYIDSLPAGSVVLFSFDHESSALPEIRPAALALLRHAFRNNLRPVGMALMAEGTGIGYRLMQKAGDEYGKTYGRDWAYLGFKPQFIAAILSMGESFQQTFPRDYLGNPYDSLPVLAGVKNYDNVAGVISITDGSLTVHWIEYGNSRYKVTVSAAMTAAMMTTYDPYISSGQLHAIVGGLPGAAEYEKLLQITGGGQRGMLAQSAAHLYIIALIIIGNILYFTQRRRTA